jgi:hypothetical protein
MTLATSAVGAGPLPPLQAVLVGGARVFTADAVAGASKAEAVRVMQRYETSLHNSGQQVVPAQADATTSRTFQVDGTTTAAGVSALGGGTGGVPWARLAGGAPPGQPGALTGAGPGGVQSVLAAERAALADAAARRAMGAGGFFAPPMAAQAGDDDRERPHRNNLPNVDNGIFTLDQRTSAPVIGDVTDREHNIGL